MAGRPPRPIHIAKGSMMDRLDIRQEAVAPASCIACECAGTILYSGNPVPDKASWFEIDGCKKALKGQLPAMMRALMVAGKIGVENRQCRLFSLNPGDHVSALRKHGTDIYTLRGKPNRWVLQSRVREVTR